MSRIETCKYITLDWLNFCRLQNCILVPFVPYHIQVFNWLDCIFSLTQFSWSNRVIDILNTKGNWEISSGLYTASIWPLYGLHMASIRPLYGLYMASTRPLYGLYTASIRPLYGLYAASIRPLYGLYAASIRPLCGLHMASTRPLYGLDTASIWPSFTNI
jgi:hypothetical protein